MTHVLLQGCRVHGHQHVAFVTRGVYVGTYAYLKAADSSERALRSADFCRIVGEGGNFVAKSGGYVGEDVSHELHAVAGVAGETDHHFIQVFYACFC